MSNQSEQYPAWPVWQQQGPPVGAWPAWPPAQVGYAPYQTQYVNVQPSRRGMNHGVHVLLDIFTCGLWLPVHALVWTLHSMTRR